MTPPPGGSYHCSLGGVHKVVSSVVTIGEAELRPAAVPRTGCLTFALMGEGGGAIEKPLRFFQFIRKPRRSAPP